MVGPHLKGLSHPCSLQPPSITPPAPQGAGWVGGWVPAVGASAGSLPPGEIWDRVPGQRGFFCTCPPPALLLPVHGTGGTGRWRVPAVPARLAGCPGCRQRCLSLPPGTRPAASRALWGFPLPCPHSSPLARPPGCQGPACPTCALLPHRPKGRATPSWPHVPPTSVLLGEKGLLSLPPALQCH